MVNPKPQPTDSGIPIYSTRSIVHAPGAIVGRYQIIRQLSQGTAEPTYLAKNLDLNGDSRCVIEQFPLWLNARTEREAVTKLSQQLEILQRLGERPQIARYWTYFIDERQIYTIREYIDGEGLEQKIKRRIFNEAQVIRLLQDVLKTLDLIHKNNLIHQAIEPAHIIERREPNRYVLANFGAVKTLNDSPKDLVSSFQFDTESYAVPEQQARRANFSSDIYSLGKTAIFCLTGRTPQELAQSNKAWRRYCQISDKLADIIEKMTDANCQERYQTALAVLYDLQPLFLLEQVIDGRYRILEHLQEKSAIDVYLAENLRRPYQSPCIVERVELGEYDAISWQEIEQHLKKQLATVEKLKGCPQLPKLWDHFQENGVFYLVKEHLPGENLNKVLARKNLSEAELIRFLESALAALAFIHQHRSIHRYLRPENLLMSDRQQVVLTGLGIIEDIWVLYGENLARNYQSNYSGYLAPEQIAGRPTLSSDLYALGIIAIEALTGTKPESLVRSQSGKIVWQEEIVGKRLAKIIAKMTALDVGRRYQTVESVIKELRKVETQSVLVAAANNNSSLVHTSQRSMLQPVPMAIAALGIASLLASIEFAFPLLRPTYYWYRGKQLLPDRPQIALNAFIQATKLQPNSYFAWDGKGDALQRLQRYKEALAAYEVAGKVNSENFDNWKKKGDVFYRLENFPQALLAYDRALELRPNDGVTLNSKGKTLENLELYQEALSFHEAALEREPLNAEFMSDRARVLIGLGRYYDALTVLDRVRELEPNSPQLWQDRVFALQALGRPQEAERVYREVVTTYQTLVEKMPEDYDLWLAQGDFLTQLRNTQVRGLFGRVSSQNTYSTLLHIQSKALAAYEEAIATSPQSYLAWIGKAQTLSAAGEYQAALLALDRALQIRPQADRPWQIRGSILKDGLERPEAAVAAYDKALAINPNFALLWRDRGLALAQAEQYSQAVTSFLKATQLNPQDSETWMGLANALQTLQQHEDALSAIDRALALEPQNPSLWQTKGSILTKQGNYDAACDTYRESRQFAPDFAPITQAMNIVGCRMDSGE